MIVVLPIRSLNASKLLLSRFPTSPTPTAAAATAISLSVSLISSSSNSSKSSSDFLLPGLYILSFSSLVKFKSLILKPSFVLLFNNDSKLFLIIPGIIYIIII